MVAQRAADPQLQLRRAALRNRRQPGRVQEPVGRPGRRLDRRPRHRQDAPAAGLQGSAHRAGLGRGHVQQAAGQDRPAAVGPAELEERRQDLRRAAGHQQPEAPHAPRRPGAVLRRQVRHQGPERQCHQCLRLLGRWLGHLPPAARAHHHQPGPAVPAQPGHRHRPEPDGFGHEDEQQQPELPLAGRRPGGGRRHQRHRPEVHRHVGRRQGAGGRHGRPQDRRVLRADLPRELYQVPRGRSRWQLPGRQLEAARPVGHHVQRGRQLARPPLLDGGRHPHPDQPRPRPLRRQIPRHQPAGPQGPDAQGR
mmetsp:Transcript_1397/g.4102  ORF Transcript_1397/g.4102 Transcript_1397/m.4102 type:complete len:308 (-) Transcript_1397:1412-2335(-)